ncbi:MAG: hypothetical protein LBR98_02935 [Syntrophomonadaceae bacterium]|jgi:hypothetical protein|nr:hypothetical protein [Syntrophomonadaceae bacterium]
MSGENRGTITTETKNIIWYPILFVSAIGLFFCIALLFSHVREMFIEISQQYVFNQKLKPHHVIEARRILEVVARGGIFFIAFFDFLTLTAPGRFLLNKSGFIDIHKTQIIGMGKSFLKNKIFSRPFDIFAFLIGFFVLMIAASRAANTGITYDEASTYFHHIYRGIPEAIMGRQYLNNHILNSLLIRFV